MEEKTLTNEERAIISETKRLDALKEKREWLAKEFAHFTAHAEKVKETYIEQLDAIDKSIASGEAYVNNLKTKPNAN